MPTFKEELLHHIWQHQLFSSQALQTVDGQAVEIIRPGRLNTNAGPDFTNARIKVANTEWAGNIEIHIYSSDWLRHNHQANPSYSNIILHVVFEDDLKQPLGAFPTLELKNYISDQVLKRYKYLRNSTHELPCDAHFLEVPGLITMAWLDALLIARLQRKSEWMSALVEEANADLEQAFMMVLFSAFGMKVNAQPFQQLAKQTPWKVLAKHQDNCFQLEAILFGNAGFLENLTDSYAHQLQKEYAFLQHKYGLKPLDKSQWKFLRLRPANFPTVRLAQLAALFHKTGPFYHWFTNQRHVQNHAALQVEPSSYWQTHYTFGTKSAVKTKRIGKTMVNNILINAFAPFLFVSAQRHAKPMLQEKALSLLQQLPAEKNVKVKPFALAGLAVNNAAESQALIELKTNYCNHKKCLSCSIGATILKRTQ